MDGVTEGENVDGDAHQETQIRILERLPRETLWAELVERNNRGESFAELYDFLDSLGL
jgi:hypothetical protein